MSFNLASLIAGPSKSKTLIKESLMKTETKKKTENKKETKKSFTHGINVIFNKGTYKGYQGFVSDFFPATYELTATGKTYVEADKYGRIMDIGSEFVSDFGNSKVERFIPYSYGTYVRMVIYRKPETNDLRVGVITENQKVILQSLQNQGYSMDEIREVENGNNQFIIDVSVSTASLIMNMSSLNIGNAGISDALVEKLNQMHVDDHTQKAPVQLIEQVAEELASNSSLLDKIIYPERFIDIKGEITVIPVFKANVVGPVYYMNVSQNLGEFTVYNPNKNQYYISYTRSVAFKPSMLKIDQTDKRYAIVKKGEFANKRFKIKKYNPARLTVTLTSMGRTVNSHVVQVKDNQDNLVLDSQGNIKFESTPIYPADVFYMDVLLKNGNTAQVNKILENDHLEVLEKDESNRTYIKRTISKDEIKTLEPGFSFNEQTQVQTTKSSANLGDFLVSSEQPVEEEQQVYDEEEDQDSKEYDGYEGNAEANDEGVEDIMYDREAEEPKASFKDTQRTSVQHAELTSQQTKFKAEITNVLNYLGLHDEVIDVYAMINNLEEFIKILVNKLKAINYEQDILVTSNIKFIIVCLILYDITKQGIRMNLEQAVSKLYPKYFSIKDIKASSLNNNIFIKYGWNTALTQNIIDQAINKINQYIENEKMYPEIVNSILLNCDIALQDILGTRYNITSSVQQPTIELIPVGVNPVTGRRFKVEREEAALAKARSGFKQYSINIDDILHDRIPEKEVEIRWTSEYLPILAKFQQILQNKFDTQGKKDYMYIKDNLYRAPFALRDNNLLIVQDGEKIFIPLQSNVKKAFESTYRKLVEQIIQHKSYVERVKMGKRKEQEDLNERRRKLIKPSDEEELFGDEYVPVNTRAFNKEKGMRDMKQLIAKGTRAANRNAYREKRERTQEDTNKEPTVDYWGNPRTIGSTNVSFDNSEEPRVDVRKAVKSPGDGPVTIPDDLTTSFPNMTRFVLKRDDAMDTSE